MLCVCVHFICEHVPQVMQEPSALMGRFCIVRRKIAVGKISFVVVRHFFNNNWRSIHSAQEFSRYFFPQIFHADFFQVFPFVFFPLPIITDTFFQFTISFFFALDGGNMNG